MCPRPARNATVSLLTAALISMMLACPSTDGTGIDHDNGDTGETDAGDEDVPPDTTDDDAGDYECQLTEDCDGDDVCIDATCVAVECSDPSTPPGTSVSTDGYLPGDTATYDCEPEHDLIGDRQRTCTEDGAWSGNPPSCTPFSPPDVQTLFTYPPPGDVDDSIEDHVIDLLDTAPSGSKVRASFYSFSRVRVAQAFVDAHNRGADVRVIVNNHNVHPDGSYYAGVELLDEELGNRLTICHEDEEPQQAGCVGDRINHNKFITFSELVGGGDHVVMQTTSNMNNPQREEVNTLVTVHGDTGLYNAYLDHWNDQQAQQIDTDYYHYVDGDDDTRVYFFPRQEGDTIVEILDDVHCDDDSSLHVAMAWFTDARVEIAQRLADLHDDGCAVNVLIDERTDYDTPGSNVVDALSTGDIDLAYFPEADFQAGDGMKLHSKHMLIDAPFGDNKVHQQLVLTGSHNFNVSSLERNDEALMKLRDAQTHQDFVDDWNTLRPGAVTLHP